MLLGGVKVVDRGEAERRLRDERKAAHKKHRRDKKQAKSKHQRHRSADGGGSSSGGDEKIGSKQRSRGRKQQWDDPDDSGGSDSDGDGGGGGGGGGGGQREDWMTKPMARPKTDAQLAAEEEEREQAEEDRRRQDPDRVVMSVSRRQRRHCAALYCALVCGTGRLRPAAGFDCMHWATHGCCCCRSGSSTRTSKPVDRGCPMSGSKRQRLRHGRQPGWATAVPAGASRRSSGRRSRQRLM